MEYSRINIKQSIYVRTSKNLKSFMKFCADIENVKTQFIWKWIEKIRGRKNTHNNKFTHFISYSIAEVMQSHLTHMISNVFILKLRVNEFHNSGKLCIPEWLDHDWPKYGELPLRIPFLSYFFKKQNQWQINYYF